MAGPRARTLQRRLARLVPARGTSLLAPLYNRYLCARAGRQFSAASLDVGDPSADAPRHVVLVVVDALRYDFARDEVASGSFDLVEAVTPATWTFPAVTSLLTGQYPHEHGAMRRTDEGGDRHEEGLVLPERVDRETPTLSRLLAAAGYETYGGFAFYMPFAAPFGQFGRNRLYNDAPAEPVLADHLEWLGRRRSDRTFSYLHLGDLHEPVDPPVEYWDAHGVDGTIPNIRSWDYVESADVGPEGQRYREHRVELYRAALDYVTDALEDYVEAIRDAVEDEPLILVTSDHGEAFWEMAAFDETHFYDDRPAYAAGHGGTPYEAVAKVPIFVNRDVGDLTEPRSTLDVVPSVLDWTGLDGLGNQSGSSLLEDGGRGRNLVEASRYGYEKKASYDGDTKLVVSKSDGVVATFALPEEEPTTVTDLARSDVLERFPEWPANEGTGTAVSRQVATRLERLGYK